MDVNEINNSTDHILQINVNFFVVQQLIDHLQLSIPWSPYQCSISILHFYQQNLLKKKKKTAKYEEKNRKWMWYNNNELTIN